MFEYHNHITQFFAKPQELNPTTKSSDQETPTEKEENTVKINI
uniref:Uncharacterized protein n=1 Tax=viral metagenome TaxID=1070528 RepID=A0A6C0HVI6_9ZZZZ